MKTLRILVVEDEIIIAHHLKLELLELGVSEVTVVTRGKNAVDAADRTPFDLILMDIRLAGEMDGISAAKQISVKTKVPIVFMSGYNEAFSGPELNGINVLGRLEKPVNFEQLKKIIKDLSSGN